MTMFFCRYFVGSAESTFSFRIQEEREILGFEAESTFNMLCKDTRRPQGNGINTLTKFCAEWNLRLPPMNLACIMDIGMTNW